MFEAADDIEYSEDEEPEYEPDEPDVFDDALIQEEISDIIRSVRPDFVPESEEDFDWIMSKIRGYENEKKDRDKAYRQKIRELDSKINFFKNRFRLELEAFATAKLAESLNKKKKSIKLPCGGMLGYRLSTWKLRVTNPDDFASWVELSGIEGAVKSYQPVIDKRLVDQYVKQCGEIPSGTEIQHPQDEFYIK